MDEFAREKKRLQEQAKAALQTLRSKEVTRRKRQQREREGFYGAVAIRKGVWPLPALSAVSYTKEDADGMDVLNEIHSHSSKADR